jgi:hypothetical protein
VEPYLWRDGKILAPSLTLVTSAASARSWLVPAGRHVFRLFVDAPADYAITVAGPKVSGYLFIV